jgi:hypothetical protein
MSLQLRAQEIPEIRSPDKASPAECSYDEDEATRVRKRRDTGDVNEKS